MSEDMPITSQPTTPEQPDGTVPRVEGVPEEVMPAETPLAGMGLKSEDSVPAKWMKLDSAVKTK